MDTTNAMVSWLQDKSGVTITSNQSPNRIEFTINHATGITHKQFINEVYKHKLWLISSHAPNTGTKDYVMANTKPTW